MTQPIVEERDRLMKNAAASINQTANMKFERVMRELRIKYHFRIAGKI